MFAILFVLAIIPFLLVSKKLLKRKELNIFDLIIVFSSLFFWVIPVRDFLFVHLRPEYTQHITTAIAICLYMWLLWMSSCCIKSTSPLLITKYLAQIHIGKIKESFLWFALPYILYMFIQTTSYSTLNEDNIDGNNSFFYGNELPYFLRIIVYSFRPFFPVLLLVIWRLRPFGYFYMWLRRICIFLIVATLLLGPKTFFITTGTIFMLYMYSVNRKKISTKKLAWFLVGIIIFTCVFFPLSQSFRLHKQYMVFNSLEHDFITVAREFIINGIDGDIAESLDRYQKGRTLNLYDAVDFSSERTIYRGNGYMTWIIIRYIVPQKQIDDAGEIMGKLMIGGGDIGESVLAWYILDYGIIGGPIATVVHFFLISFTLYYFGMYFNRKFIKSDIFSFVILTYVLSFALNIEHNPAGDMKMFYSSYIHVILFLGIVFSIFKEKKIC